MHESHQHAQAAQLTAVPGLIGLSSSTCLQLLLCLTCRLPAWAVNAVAFTQYVQPVMNALGPVLPAQFSNVSFQQLSLVQQGTLHPGAATARNGGAGHAAV
jgi:hypothetical protein